MTMPTRRRTCFAALAGFAAGAGLFTASPALLAQTAAPAAAANPLAPIAHWVGGEWVGEFESGGRRFKLIRSYQWSFDQRLIIGRSFGESEGRRRQSRETVFFWNPQSRRIEFHDHLDQSGGHGVGFVEARDGGLYMDVQIVGNPSHPAWRAWISEDGDEQRLRVEALRDGRWGDFGSYTYRRVR